MRAAAAASDRTEAAPETPDVLAVAAALRWERPDLTGQLADHVLGAAAASADRDRWLVAAGWAVHARSATGDGRATASSALEGLRRWGPSALAVPAAYRLRVELALVAIGTGQTDRARALLAPVVVTGTSPLLRADARAAVARCAVEDAPGEVMSELRNARAAWSEVPEPDANLGLAAIELVAAAAQRRAGRPDASAAAAAAGLTRLRGRPANGSTGTPPTYLAAALTTEWISALLDTGRVDEAQDGCEPLFTWLSEPMRPCRQLARLRLTMARAVAPGVAPRDTADALAKAAQDAADSDAPDLEVVSRSALGALLQQLGQAEAARAAVRLAELAERRDKHRDQLFRAVLGAATVPSSDALAADRATAPAVTADRGVPRFGTPDPRTHPPARRQQQRLPGMDAVAQGPIRQREAAGQPTVTGEPPASVTRSDAPPGDAAGRHTGPAGGAPGSSTGGDVPTEPAAAGRGGTPGRTSDRADGGLPASADGAAGQVGSPGRRPPPAQWPWVDVPLHSFEDVPPDDAGIRPADADRGSNERSGAGANQPVAATEPARRHATEPGVAANRNRAGPGLGDVGDRGHVWAGTGEVAGSVGPGFDGVADRGGATAGFGDAVTDAGAATGVDRTPRSRTPRPDPLVSAPSTGGEPLLDWPWGGPPGDSPIGDLIMERLRANGTAAEPPGRGANASPDSRPVDAAAEARADPGAEAVGRRGRSGPVRSGTVLNPTARMVGPITGSPADDRPANPGTDVLSTPVGGAAVAGSPVAGSPVGGAAAAGVAPVAPRPVDNPWTTGRWAGTTSRSRTGADVATAPGGPDSGVAVAGFSDTSSAAAGSGSHSSLTAGGSHSGSAGSSSGSGSGSRPGSAGFGPANGFGSAAGSGPSASAGPRLGLAAGFGTDTGTDTGTGSDARSDTETGTDTGAGSGAGAWVGSGSGAGVRVGAGAGPRVGSGVGAGSRSGDGSGSGIGVGSETGVGSATAAGFGVAAGPDPLLGAAAKAGPRSTSGLDTTATAGPEQEPRLRAGFDDPNRTAGDPPEASPGTETPAPVGSAGESCRITIDVARDGRRFAGPRAAAVLRTVAGRLQLQLPVGARMGVDAQDGLSIELPAMAHGSAASWLHRRLPGLLDDLTLDDDLARLHLRSIVYGTDGPVGAQLLVRLDQAHPDGRVTAPADGHDPNRPVTRPEPGGFGEPVPPACGCPAEPAITSGTPAFDIDLMPARPHPADAPGATRLLGRPDARPAGDEGTADAGPGGGAVADPWRPPVSGGAAGDALRVPVPGDPQVAAPAGRHDATGRTPFRPAGGSGTGRRRHRRAPDPTPSRAPDPAPRRDLAPSRAPDSASSWDLAPSRAPDPASSWDLVPSRAPDPAPSRVPELAPSRAPDPASSRVPELAPSRAPDPASSRVPEVAPSRAPDPAPASGRPGPDPADTDGLGLADLLAGALAAYRGI